jgi:hypothetical protein
MAQENAYLSAEEREPLALLAPDLTSIETIRELPDCDNMVLNGALLGPPTELPEFRRGSLEWNNMDIQFTDFLTPATANQPGRPPFGLSIPVAPTLAVRTLVQRPKPKREAHLIANLIFSTLKSLPLMMMRHNALPPFKHPRCDSSPTLKAQMESWANCTSLIRMISTGVRESRKLFWKNVRMECERLQEEAR